MMKATKVGIREFRLGLAVYIASSTPVAVTRHGQTVGYFIPAQGNHDAEVAALKQAGQASDVLLARHEFDEETKVAEFKRLRLAPA